MPLFQTAMKLYMPYAIYLSLILINEKQLIF